MALAPRDIPIFRTQMQGWINEYPGGDQTLEDYLRDKINAMNLADRKVRTPQGDVDIVDHVLGDLKSYVLNTP